MGGEEGEKMPNTEVITDIDQITDKEKLAEEKKRLKSEQKEQKREAKRRAKELYLQEAQLDDDSGASGVSVFLVTTLIVVVWIAILCLLVKLDVGGFGSSVLTPVLKNVPVINKILPSTDEVTDIATETGEDYGGYKSLEEAVKYIKELELELQSAQSAQSTSSEEVANLKAEVERLKTFENNQVEFQRIKTEFYEEVVYAENGPGAEEYKKYYESIDPATAEYLYKQVVQQVEESDDVKEYAQAYSEMKPKEAAAIFESMTDNLGLASRILSVMSAEDRGKILGVMDPATAARITKIMDPES
jgi:flagellar motility protein MotE (MotC chaperone)